MIVQRQSPAVGPNATSGEVPPPQPVPPMPGPDVPGIELPPDPTTQIPPGSPVGPDIEDPPVQPAVPVREPPGAPPREHVTRLAQR